jgi:hypothetical protein
MKETISMSDVSKRYKPSYPSAGIYPLFQNYNKKYNFENIMEAVDHWDVYSKSEEKCFRQILELSNIVNSKGTATQKNIINEKCLNCIFEIKELLPLYSIVNEFLMENPNNNLFKELLLKLDEVSQCDRIIENHKFLSKRFNIDKLVTEHMIIEKDNIEDTIYELCSLVDTYNYNINTKYIISLEETIYSFWKNHINCPHDIIVENITDYYLANHLNKNDENGKLLNILKESINNSKFFSAKDCSYIDELYQFIPNVKEESMTDTFKKSFKTIKNKFERTKDLINKFKVNPNKNESSFKELINNIFLVYKDQDVIDETPRILSLCFYFLVITGAIAFSESIVGGIIALIASKFIYIIKERSYMDKTLKKWYAHRDRISKKIDKCNDEDKKAKMKIYLKEIDKNIDKLEDYADSLKSNKEDKSYEQRPSNYSGEDDFDFDFSEDAKESAIDINIIYEAINSIKWNQPMIEDTLFNSNNTYRLAPNAIDYITEFCINNPDMMNKTKLLYALEYADKKVSKESGYEKYNKLNCYSENIDKLKSAKLKESIKEDTDVFAELNEIYEYTSNINILVDSVLNESSFSTNITLVLDKLKSKVSELSDKEKILSRTIDSTCRSIARSMDKAETSENREAIIRGDILPPASRIIKLAITSGALAYFVHPVLAVIMLVMKFAMDKKTKQKERQIVLDELEVELKMINKYIADADENKDYKKEKNLLLIKKKLETQEARLKYNIKYQWNDTVKQGSSKEDED